MHEVKNGSTLQNAYEKQVSFCVYSLTLFLQDLTYVDFDMHSKEWRALNLTDCSWEELGYSMVGRYVGDDAAKLLDEEFSAARNVTDYRVGFEETGALPQCSHCKIVHCSDICAQRWILHHTAGQFGTTLSVCGG